MSLFAKQQTKLYPPTIRYDAANDRIMLREKGHEIDITDRRSALNPSTLSWGWCAYAVGAGKVVKDLVTVANPMPPRPTAPAGKTKKGEPAQWHAYACVNTLVAGITVRCLFEMVDDVIHQTLSDLCQNAADPKKLVLEYTGSEERTDADGDLIRVPAFNVVAP
jgi:hypothetical protein